MLKSRLILTDVYAVQGVYFVNMYRREPYVYTHMYRYTTHILYSIEKKIPYLWLSTYFYKGADINHKKSVSKNMLKRCFN